MVSDSGQSPTATGNGAHANQNSRPPLWLVLPIFAVAATATAARAEATATEAKGPPVFLGAEFALGSPQGEFAKHVDEQLRLRSAPGVQLASVLGIRFDIAHLIYGSDSWKAMNPSFPGVSFEMNTTNTMTYFGLGPQLTGRLGPLRPFVNASVGMTYLATSTELRGNNKEENVTEDTNFKDFTLAYGAGAGLAIAIPRGKARPSHSARFTRPAATRSTCSRVACATTATAASRRRPWRARPGCCATRSG